MSFSFSFYLFLSHVLSVPPSPVPVPRPAPFLLHLVPRPARVQVPSMAAGDVVVMLATAKHESITRHGDTLVVDKEVSLGDALCGFSFDFVHLDGRRLKIHSQRGEVSNTKQRAPFCVCIFSMMISSFQW